MAMHIGTDHVVTMTEGLNVRLILVGLEALNNQVFDEHFGKDRGDFTIGLVINFRFDRDPSTARLAVVWHQKYRHCWNQW